MIQVSTPTPLNVLLPFPVQLPTLEPFAGNTHDKFLLDSGAAISVVNYNVVKEVPISSGQ